MQNFFQDEENVVFNCGLKLKKPGNMAESEFEKWVYQILKKNYPGLEEYQKLADVINETYCKDYPEFRIRFIPNFTWNKNHIKITKIGIRATNSLVSATNKNDENYIGIKKTDILEKYELYLSKDVKSSVPRLTLSLNCSQWIAENLDIYEMIYTVYRNNTKHQNELEGKSFANLRYAVKNLFMCAYFDEESRLAANTMFKMSKVPDKTAVKEEMTAF